MRRRRDWLAIVLGVVTALMLAVLGFLGFLGYFGGPIYRSYPVVTPTRGMTVVFLSGDMGINAGMGPRLIGDLHAHGLPVLAVNSLAAFASRRTPAEVDAMIAATVDRALHMPGTQRLVLIGQSFGADMLQHGLANLPAALRPKVAGVILLVPGSTLLFKANPGGVFYGAPDASALPTARRIGWVPVTCIYGANEVHSLCPLLTQANVRAVALPGGHFLDYNIKLVAQTLRQSIAHLR